MPDNKARKKDHSLPTKQSVAEWMVAAVPTANRQEDVDTVIKRVLNPLHTWDEIDSIFIVDEGGRPTGYVSIERLVNSKPAEKIAKIMSKPVRSVIKDDDQEKAAILSISQKLESIPVIDSDGKLVGAVPARNILAILQLENVEDTLKTAGISVEPDVKDLSRASVAILIRLRLPWLLLGLAGGIIATLIVGGFEKALKETIALSFFIPIIVYMSGAIGVQTQTLYIRRLTLGKIPGGVYVLREAFVGSTIGVICSLVVTLFAYLWLSSVTIAFIVGIAMFAGMTSAVLIGIFIPWFISFLNRDPAFGSGPFATVLQDILSIMIYFFIAYLILFGPGT